MIVVHLIRSLLTNLNTIAIEAKYVELLLIHVQGLNFLQRSL